MGANDFLHERLLATIGDRAPTAAEESTLTATLSELPPVYHAALEALLDGHPARLALSPDDAAWSWQLQTLADFLPSAKVVWQGASMFFTLEGHALGLVVESGEDPCLRVATDVDRRLTGRPGSELALHVRPALEPLVAACEVNCVAGCCGLDAFEIGPAPIAQWVKAAGKDAARAARCELDTVLAELATAAGPVSSMRFNAVWKSGRECASLLETMRRHLDEALTRSQA